MAALAKKTGALDPRLAGDWAEIVGPDLAKICRPVQMRSHGRAKSLEVAVANGAAAMQVQYRQDFIIQKVNTKLGHNRISRLTIRQTGATALKPRKSAYSRPAQPPMPAHMKKKSVTPGEELETALSTMRKLLDRDKSR